MILHYIGASDPHTKMRLNELILWESRLILSRRGQNYDVASGHGDGRKLKIGQCYANCAIMMLKGLGYVEGYVKNKQTGSYIGHAWNVNDSGDHLDFTFKITNEYDYFGVLIPDEVVWSVGERNGHIWYCVLPFVDQNFLIKEH